MYNIWSPVELKDPVQGETIDWEVLHGWCVNAFTAHFCIKVAQHDAKPYNFTCVSQVEEGTHDNIKTHAEQLRNENSFNFWNSPDGSCSSYTEVDWKFLHLVPTFTAYLTAYQIYVHQISWARIFSRKSPCCVLYWVIVYYCIILVYSKWVCLTGMLL